LKIEQIAEQFSGALGDHHDVRLGNALQSCRKVWRLTNDCLLLSCTQSDQIANYDQSGGNPHAGLQWSTRLQPAHRLDQLGPCDARAHKRDELAPAHRFPRAETLFCLVG
jgi:hypothetical protein